MCFVVVVCCDYPYFGVDDLVKNREVKVHYLVIAVNYISIKLTCINFLTNENLNKIIGIFISRFDGKRFSPKRATNASHKELPKI